MMLQNLHTHTVFGDGQNTPEEMVLGAVQAGCAALGFSEHSPLPPAANADDWAMAEADVAVYRAELLRLREQYRGTLDIFLGLEQDLDSPPPALPWDYLIGSVHSVLAGGVHLSVDESPASFERSVREHFGGDCLAFAEAYYRRVAVAAERTRCQIVGHFDLVTKFNEGGRLFDEESPRYRAAALEALEAAMRRDVIFEINTGAMSRGYRSAPYPAPFLLEAIRERGGRVCITSDSHSRSTVAHAFPQAAEAASACGFREVWMLSEKGFFPVGLEAFSAEAGNPMGTGCTALSVPGH